MTIKGVGLITVAIILAETQGFEFVQNIKQLTSYAGLDVVLKNIKISYPGHGTVEDAKRIVPEDESRYPEQFFFETYRRMVPI